MGVRVDNDYWKAELKKHEGHTLEVLDYDYSTDVVCSECGDNLVEIYKEDQDSDDDNDDQDEDEDEDPEPETVCKRCGSDDLLENSLLCAECAKQNELGV